MTAQGRLYRPLPEIAKDILEEGHTRIPQVVRASISALTQLHAVEDEDAYKVVAKARISMNQLRSPAAKRVKHELETILSHYRADNWPD